MRSIAPCVALVALVGSGAAEAACDITDVAPTGVIPTTTGQPFTFVATSDCAMLSFTAQSFSITKTPRPGMMMGPGARRYSVSLTAAEWNSIASSDATKLWWAVSGQFAGTTTRVSTRNDLDFDGDGWTRSEGDEVACDLDASRNPGVEEICDNGVDDNCDSAVDRCDLSLSDADLLIEGEHPSASPFHGIGDAVGIADLNADGVADVLLGDPSAGLAHVVYGPISGVIGSDTGATLRAYGPGVAGFGVGIDGGDADGDGIADALVGVPKRNLAYLFLGPISASRNSQDADAQLVGRPDSNHDYTGGTVLVGPDHDGDGVRDIVVAGHDYKEGTGPYRGAVYVTSGNVTGTIDLEATASYLYFGAAAGEELGTRVDTLGDWNGDGIDDLAVSAPGGGSAYVIEGGDVPGRYFVDDVAAATIGDERETIELGGSLAAADYDGDGASDLFVGEPLVQDPPGSFLGRVMSFSGPLSGTVDVSDADTTWEGEQGDWGSGLGQDIAVGDADGDGAPDVLMGDWYGGPDSEGAVYVQLGWVTGTASVENLPAIASHEFMRMGSSVAFVPDWDGDGGSEVLFGAPSATDPAGTEKGAVYMFFSNSLFP